MASQTELRLGITEVCSAIDLQNQVLRDLEKKKSGLQIQLNSILDPMARVPLEISSDIFLRCLPQEDPIPNKNTAPLVFLNVCHLWTNIALATPSLWDNMDIRDRRRAGFPQLMEKWFLRSGSRPLTVALSGTQNQAIRNEVYKNASRMQGLELFFPSGEHLKKMKMSFPSLKTLAIGQGQIGYEPDFNTEYRYSEYPSGCVDMLLAAPQLVDCTLSDLCYEAYSIHSVSTHSSLKRLRFEGEATKSMAVLHYLTLPALESLVISHFSINYDAFLRFLTRSAPPLRFLHMTPPEEWKDATGSAAITDFCRLVPGLVSLEVFSYIGRTEQNALPNFLNAINGQDLLPILRKLSFRGYAPPHPAYETLIDVISARRGKLEKFVLRGVPQSPDEDIIARLRQLVEGGTEILIARKSRNYLVVNDILAMLLSV
ncbi:hypothetical protein C8R43DRAFT_1205119 [Mycena crocata]|nr:hypothetical protein C8R43DRAFT_1205119 [Mycena crocata]